MAAWTSLSTGSPPTPTTTKRGLGRFLYNRVRGITNTQDNLQKEEHHPSNILRWNGYPGGFICSATRPPQREKDAQDSLPDEGSSPPLVMLPYTAGVSKDIRQVCRKYGMRVIFRSGLSLRSVLTRVKDPLPMESGPRLCTESPAVVARSTSVRPEEDWRRG